MTKKIVVLCASAAFYEHVCQLAEELESKGYTAVVPATARKMQAAGNFDVSKNKTWYDNPDDFVKKRALMEGHFEEIAKGDAILVVNDKKHGIDGYIGANVLMEIAIAFYLKKPIFILQDIAKESNVYEEIMGMAATQLGGDINNLDY